MGLYLRRGNFMEYTQNERIEIVKFIEENFGKVEEIYEVDYV